VDSCNKRSYSTKTSASCKLPTEDNAVFIHNRKQTVVLANPLAILPHTDIAGYLERVIESQVPVNDDIQAL